MSGTPRLIRLSLVAALAAVIAACSGTTASPSAAPSVAPSVAAPSVAPSESVGVESPSASAATGASASPAARTVEMYAIDGAFQNPPVDPTPGTVITLRNVGTEAHELRVLRRNDDATDKQTFEDLSKVKPEDLLKFTTVVAVLSADPNTVADGQIVLDQEGDYAAVDFLPKGTATAASPDPSMAPADDSNYASGMFTTFTVIPPAE